MCLFVTRKINSPQMRQCLSPAAFVQTSELFCALKLDEFSQSPALNAADT